MVQEINNKLNMWVKEEYLQEVHSDPSDVQKKISKSDASCLNHLNLLPNLKEKAINDKNNNKNC